MNISGTISEINGQKFFIDDKSDEIEKTLYYGRYYEENMINYILNNYKKNTFIDIGSSIGTHSIPFSKIADIVYSFEPIKHLCFRQMANLTLNKIENVSVINCALGDINLEHYIIDPKTNIGDNVLVIKLDDFRIDNISIIKLDVDGFELRVLKGAIKTIKRNKPDLFISCINNNEFIKLSKFLYKLGYKYSGLKFNNTPTYLFKYGEEK